MNRLLYLLLLCLLTGCSLPLIEDETETIINGENNSHEDNQYDNGSIYKVEALPEVGSLWEGHFVACTLGDNDKDIVPMLLLSTSEWTRITSAMNEETPHAATDIASSYAEGELTSWRIPTRQEASKMCTTLGNTVLEETNAFLTANGIAPLGTGKDTETKELIRYLCDDAEFSFKWDSEGTPSKAGSKRGYHLRLVKNVRFSVTEE